MHLLLTVFPQGKEEGGCGGREEGGGGRGELLHLTEPFLLFPSGRRRGATEGNRTRINQEKGGGQVDYCVCQLEVTE